MKFRYFLTLIASVLVFAGCMQESIDSFESIKLDKTYLTIPETGGEVELTITATQDWNFVETEMWPRVIAYQKDSNGKEIKDEDGNKVIDESKTVPSWLTLKGEMSGKAGETKVVFAAEPTNGGREIELSIKAGNNVQYFRVRQGTMLASDATCAEVIAGVDGKSYRVQGVCTSIANDYYGNFYLNDGTGEIYIYGTKDGDGQYNWDDFNIEVGDSVKVEGPRKDYNGTIELVDALFIKVIKSLIKLVEPTDKMVDREGETFDVKLAYKGKGVFYTVADECSSWVKIEGMTSKSGEPTKLEPNPADTAIVTVTVAPFEELSSRAGSIEFSSSLDDAKSVITFSFRQGVEAKTAAEFNAMEKGNVPYKVTGCVREITNTLYGNMYVADHTGSVYVYGTLDAEGNSKNFESLGIEVGDIVSVVSPVDVYNNAAQMKNATVAEKIDVEAKTVEAFLATEEDKTYYRLTGTVSGIADGDIYGNMTITDETGSVYVYGLLSGYGGEKKLFQDLVADTGLSNGDKLTLVGYHTSHNGKAQVGGAFYLLHEAGSEGGEEAKVVTVQQFKDAAEDATVYQLTGTVKEITYAYSAEYGNISFDLEDETGFVNIFRMSCKGIEDPTAISVGDEITVQGTRSSHNDNIQMAQGGKCIKFTDKDGAEEPDTKTERNLAFSASTATATLGEEFTAPTLSGETDGVAYSSSNTAVATVDAATGAVTLVAAGETTITATAAETETLLAGTASYTLTVSAAEVVEPEFEAGQYWIVANNLVAKPVTSNLGYLYVEDAWKSASSVASTQANAFTFTSVEGGYTIQDEAGKYYYGTVYNDAWSKNFNVSATLPAEGAIWKIVKNDDDTYTITNTTQPSYLQYSVSYKSFGHYTTAQTNAVLPTLVKVENAVPAVTLASSLTFEAEGGSQTITLPEGVSAVPSCDNAAFTATASANVVTVSAAATTAAQSGVLTLVLNYNGFSLTKTVDLTQKAAPVAGEEVLLDEDFSSLKTWSTSSVTSLNVNNLTYNTAGGTMYGQKGCIKFGKGTAAANTGVKLPALSSLTTAKTVTLTFKAVSSDSGYTMSVAASAGATVGTLSPKAITQYTGGGINSGADSETKLVEAFAASTSEFSVTIQNVTAQTVITITASGSAKRWYLDDVKIVTK